MIAGVGLLMSLASAQQNDYNQYCNPPSNPPPEVQVEPGLYRKYHCDKSPSSSAYLGLPPVQASPDECTRQCAARVDHAKCSWSEGYCFFYGPSASITGHHGAIYVTYRKDQTAQINQLTQDLDNCRQHNDVIEAAATACLSDLAQCETDRDTCIAARDTCTQDLDDCQAANNGGNGGGTSGDIPECMCMTQLYSPLFILTNPRLRRWKFR